MRTIRSSTQSARRLRTAGLILVITVGPMMGSLGGTALAQSEGAPSDSTPPASASSDSTPPASAPSDSASPDSEMPDSESSDEPLPEDRGSIDPFADELIGRMASYLGAIDEFSVGAEITWEQLLPSGHKIQLSRSVAVRVRRPDRLRADELSDRGERRYMYDGETLSMHDLARNTYTIAEVPSTIDDMVDEVKERFEMSLPLVDLLVSDLRDNYERSVVSATYIGLHQIAGVRHHHLLLSNESIDYQIWIEDGPDPLPRKIVITHHDETGVPQETVLITGWNFQPQVQDVVFEFNPPADADEIELERASGDSE